MRADPPTHVKFNIESLSEIPTKVSITSYFDSLALEIVREVACARVMEETALHQNRQQIKGTMSRRSRVN